MKHLSYLNKYFVKYKWRLLLGIGFVFMSNYFRILMPQTIRDALDFVWITIKDAQEKSGPLSENIDVVSLGPALLKFGALVLFFAFMMGVFMYFMRQTIIVMSRLIEYDLRKEIFEHYEKLDLAFFKKNKTGDMMARITEDVTKVRMYLGPATLYSINLASLFVLAIIAMFKVNATLTFWTLLPLPILSISIYFVSSIIHKRSEIIQIQLAKLNSISQEVYSGIRVVKSYVQEKQFNKYFGDESEDYKQKSLNLVKVNAYFYPLIILLVSASTLLTILIGGRLVVNGSITPGNIAEFVIYINMLSWPVIAIGWIASIVQQAEASQKRVNEFLHTQPKILNLSTDTGESFDSLVFEDVSFTYPDTGIKALDHISFEIKKGEKLAIIGRTASGKSTIADLLLRMYDVGDGKIMVGGKNLKEVNLNELRNKIAYVPQDVFLFSDTIADNISFGVEDASIEEVEKMAKNAAVYEDISNFEKGFDTMVGERGVTLSGGQKQRISIARAFIKDPELIILDDCLSAVDTNTEQKIINYLSEALEDKTAIIITHRISSKITYDKIIVLERGKITEMGTHEELLKMKGYYYELLEKQKDWDEELKYS